ncbi:DoxX family protein [Nocardioidaceae bacterium SCSIO 66511]|nr:DoxX family protein [Nocardioidaceae bacterium SCSIO 66511]
MNTLHVTASVVAAAANLAAALLDLVRPRWLIANMEQVGVPASLLSPLAALKAAGAVGLIVGLWILPIGLLAGAGLVLFFVGALAAHARAGTDVASNLVPAAFLVLAGAALGLQLAVA